MEMETDLRARRRVEEVAEVVDIQMKVHIMVDQVL
jgi:hypothetical protein